MLLPYQLRVNGLHKLIWDVHMSLSSSALHSAHEAMVWAPLLHCSRAQPNPRSSAASARITMQVTRQRHLARIVNLHGLAINSEPLLEDLIVDGGRDQDWRDLLRARILAARSCGCQRRTFPHVELEVLKIDLGDTRTALRPAWRWQNKVLLVHFSIHICIIGVFTAEAGAIEPPTTTRCWGGSTFLPRIPIWEGWEYSCDTCSIPLYTPVISLYSIVIPYDILWYSGAPLVTWICILRCKPRILEFAYVLNAIQSIIEKSSPYCFIGEDPFKNQTPLLHWVIALNRPP